MQCAYVQRGTELSSRGKAHFQRTAIIRKKSKTDRAYDESSAIHILGRNVQPAQKKPDSVALSG